MKRASKFGNIKTVVDGIEFSSKKEARRYGELRILEKAGEIRDLQLQPRFPFKVNDVSVCTYVGDFSYIINPKPGDQHVGTYVLEDVKSAITRKDPVYRIKNKLFKAVMGFEITEV